MPNKGNDFVLLLGGLGSQEHDHLAAVQFSGTFDIRLFGASVGKTLHDIIAVLGMSHLTSSKTDGNLDLIAVRQELFRVLELGVKVMSIDIQGELNLLDLDGMLVFSRLFFTLRLFKAILAVVHDLADRRLRLGSYLDEVEILFVRDMLGVGSRHDAELSAVRSDYA